MKTRWIVVADAARACIFTSSSRKAVPAIVEELRHPEGRLHARDLVSDRSGTISTQGEGPHAYEPPLSPTEAELERFAHTIADRLHAAVVAGAFEELALAMPPKLLGSVRQKLSVAVRATIIAELDRRLVDARAEDIGRLVEDARQAAAP
jgi:protein required for attachment to host cells